jgi:hypothetical protein
VAAQRHVACSDPDVNPKRRRTGDLDAQAAQDAELKAQDVPPRRPEAPWPQVAPRSDPADVTGTDPDCVQAPPPKESSA